MSARSFVLKADTSGSRPKVIFEGRIDEGTDFGSFPKLTEAGADIDLDGIVAINSHGIRKWIEWSSRLAHPVHLYNVPEILTDQANMIVNFFPKVFEVQSFFVPYYCEATDERIKILYKVGEHYTADGNVKIKESILIDGNKNKEAVIDVSPKEYFVFLRRYAKARAG